MVRKVSEFEKNEQPLNWWRAFWCGFGASALLMAFVDTFNVLGVTPFSFEMYLGDLIAARPYAPNNWMIGWWVSAFMGGVFGFLYAYCFEYVFFRSGARLGIFLGFGHSAVAGIAVFPFFNAIHEFMGTGVYPSFGVLGSGLSVATPLLLVLGHLLFGATVGLFYGPVRLARVQSRAFEPGESGGPGDPEVITPEEDHEERPAV